MLLVMQSELIEEQSKYDREEEKMYYEKVGGKQPTLTLI